MVISDGIAITSALIVTVGWFVTNHLMRKSEVAKERRSYRLDMLHSFYPIIFFIQKKDYKISPGKEAEELKKLLAEARPKFLLYGYNDEIDAYEKLVESFLTEDNEAKVDCLNKVADIVRKRIRSELNLPFHDISRP